MYLKKKNQGRFVRADILLATFVFVFLHISVLGNPNMASAYQRVHIDMPKEEGALLGKSVEIFSRMLKERAGKDLFQGKGETLTIKLVIDSGRFAGEGYNIKTIQEDVVQVTGSDENGLLYGLGKLLHTSSFKDSSFVLGRWEGTSAPEKLVRGIYLATHFNNFYQSAPIDEVVKYIEELALWGYNSLQVWFDMHHYTGIDDIEAQKMQERLAALLIAGKSVGMKTGLTMLANEGYKTSPQNLRAERISFTDFYGVEICPSTAGGTELILAQADECLDAFVKLGVDIDRVWLWPYDQGGCACSECTPWGGNGFLKITKRLSALIRHKMPQTEIVLSTWLFDFKEQDKGEWRGLAEAFDKEKPWVDYIMADSHTDYPQYLIKNKPPGGLPLLNFPEISMWGNFPWGAYGANPLPDRFQKLWDTVSDKLAGGFPYSEGVFEDANKIIYSQFYWDSSISAKQSLKEYISFEFSSEHADDILTAIEIMEKNYGMSTYQWARVPDAKKIVEISREDFGAEEAYLILKQVDTKLSKSVKKSWRWRLLLLRSLLDFELRQTGGVPNETINNTFQELCDIQYLNKAHFYIKPPINFGADYPLKSIH